jgi:hypothetical protein
MRNLLIACFVLAATAAVPTATAAGPGVGSCSELTNPCWDDSFVCVWFSLQVPQCVEDDPRDLVTISAPALPPLVGQCNAATDPCWDDSVVCVWFSLQVPQCVDPIRFD